jgi:phage shock protein E
MNMEQIIKEKQGTIVDVRTQAEFADGHVEYAVNIPLHQIPTRLTELKDLKTPLVLCCASGNRSNQAHQFLQAQGIDCVNAGSWLDVEYYQSQTV